MRARLTPMTWFVILALVAIGLALGLPPDPAALQKLHTTQLNYRLAIAALLIPYVLIWYTSFFAYAKLQEYSRLIKVGKDGIAFRKFALGMGVLSFALVVPTICSLVLAYYAVRYPAFKPASTIITNYIGLIPGALAFLLLFNGTRVLIRTTKDGLSKTDIRWHGPWFLLLSAAFTHLVIQNYRNGNPYHVGLWVLIVTYIVPFLYAWMVGLMCAYELHWYARTVKGTLYRKAVDQFAKGIAVTIFGSIAIQFTNITFGQRLGNSLGSVLLANYILVMIVAAGLVLMALGTRKLKLMETL